MFLVWVGLLGVDAPGNSIALVQGLRLCDPPPQKKNHSKEKESLLNPPPPS